MNHRRITAAAAATVLVAGLGATQAASADTAATTTGSTAEAPLDLRIDRNYWACIAIDHVEIGACLENPLPDLSGLPTVPDILDDLLEALPAS